MHPEKCSLTWHAYSDHLRDMMKEMMNDDFADVTLVTEDKKHIRAHKNILSTCSPVFKDIVKLDNSPKQIIYLRGINFSDLESILQFIYLGEARLYEKRLSEFLAVARSLEIKEVYNAKTEKDDHEEEPTPSNPETTGDESQDTIFKSSHLMDETQRDNTRDRRRAVRVNGTHKGFRYACDHCDNQYTDSTGLKRHIESKHEGVKYACGQCDYQARDPSNLRSHIRSKHVENA